MNGLELNPFSVGLLPDLVAGFLACSGMLIQELQKRLPIPLGQ